MKLDARETSNTEVNLTVDFSIMILFDFETSAIWRAQSSMYLTSAAAPLPRPYVLVGVLTDTNTMSASTMAAAKERN
jgi:hypothetical protein